jgi:nucleotide-binding universal stress UspA family protein
MKHKLLVAVDGEPNSLKIIDYVARACAGSNDDQSTLVIFHVLPVFPAYYYISGTVTPGPQLLEWFDDQTRRAGIATLARTKDALVKQGGVHPDRVTTELAPERGSIAPQILQAAAAHGCDTIVVGRQGGSMVAGFFLGSVVEHLLRNPAGIAIWVID